MPAAFREELRQALWAEADRLDWTSLSPRSKSRYYRNWARDAAIGGKLARYIEPGHVRVYLKDSLLKGYSADRIADHGRPFRVLGIAEDEEVVERYRKPPGCRFADGRVVCWSRSTEWKTTLMAIYERAFGVSGERHGAVLFGACGDYSDVATRRLVEGAAKSLGVADVIWLEK